MTTIKQAKKLLSYVIPMKIVTGSSYTTTDQFSSSDLSQRAQQGVPSSRITALYRLKKDTPIFEFVGIVRSHDTVKYKVMDIRTKEEYQLNEEFFKLIFEQIPRAEKP